MVEEPEDQGSIHVAHGQFCRGFPDGDLRELEEQLEGVTIGRDRVAADGLLLAKVVDEELLKQLCK
jgi:hypothetical protein